MKNVLSKEYLINHLRFIFQILMFSLLSGVKKILSLLIRFVCQFQCFFSAPHTWYKIGTLFIKDIARLIGRESLYPHKKQICFVLPLLMLTGYLCSTYVMAATGDDAVDSSFDIIVAVSWYIFSEWGFLYALTFVALVLLVPVIWPEVIMVFSGNFVRFMKAASGKAKEVLGRLGTRGKD